MELLPARCSEVKSNHAAPQFLPPLFLSMAVTDTKPNPYTGWADRRKITLELSYNW